MGLENPPYLGDAFQGFAYFLPSSGQNYSAKHGRCDNLVVHVLPPASWLGGAKGRRSA